MAKYKVIILYKRYYYDPSKIALERTAAKNSLAYYQREGYTAVMLPEYDFEEFITINNLSKKYKL